MHDLTMNWFQSKYIRHYFKSLLAIYQVAWWFLTCKIQLVLAQGLYNKRFHLVFLKFFVVQSILLRIEKDARSGEYGVE